LQKTKKKQKQKQKIRKYAKDVVHKELYKIYYKTSIIIYSIDIVGAMAQNNKLGLGPV